MNTIGLECLECRSLDAIALDTVAMAVDFSFEDVHVLSCSILKAKNQAKSNISATFRLGGPSEVAPSVRR